jgi:hypothetical protein
VFLAFVSALVATFYLFLVPAFKPFGGVILPGSSPPSPITAWQKFAFWPPIPGTTADPFVTLLFVAPIVVTGLGLITFFIKEHSVRAFILWGAFFVELITITPRSFDFGFFFIPSASLLFAAALKDTFEAVKDQPESLPTIKKPSAMEHRSSRRLTLVAFILSVISWIGLFSLPLFDAHGRTLSAWDKYSWNSDASYLVFLFFTIPMVVAGAGYFAGKMRDKPSRRIALWIVALTMIILVVLNAANFSLYFVPSAVAFLAAAINESRKSPTVYGSTGSPRTAG